MLCALGWHGSSNHGFYAKEQNKELKWVQVVGSEE